MGDVKISQRSSTSTRTNDDNYHVIRQIAGVWTDYRISRSDNEADIYTAINTKADGSTLKLYNQNATFNQPFAADTKVMYIDVRWVSGTFTFEIGTTLGGDDIQSEETVTTSDRERNIYVVKTFESAPTLYFTVSGGGVAHVIIDYISDRFDAP